VMLHPRGEVLPEGWWCWSRISRKHVGCSHWCPNPNWSLLGEVHCCRCIEAH